MLFLDICFKWRTKLPQAEGFYYYKRDYKVFATKLLFNIFASIMKTNKNWDAIGITASVACAIHCALLPLFLTSLPLFGINIINNYFFEAGMILLALCIGSFSLYHGYKKHHHSWLPLIVFFIGFIFLVLKAIFYRI
jgi:hypothetical protein